MKAVILSDFAVPSGGAPKVAIESALALADAGVAVTFVHSVEGEDGRLDRPSIRRVGLGLKDVWELSPAKGAVKGIWNREASRRLSEILPPLGKGGQTVLHLHQWTRAFSPSIVEPLLASGMPLAVTAHDYFLSCPNGVYYRFEHEAPCALKPLSLHCLAAGCDPRSYAHKAVRVARGFATRAAISGKEFDVVHVSDRGRDTMIGFLPGGLRHHRIDNPIALAKGKAAAIEAMARFAFIGRLTKEKGAVVAARAARLADAPILFIGDGPAEAEIRAANPQAEISGWRSRDEIDKLLGASLRAVVAPSLWYETGPLTVLEAAAAGVASIASNRCGAAERVQHEVSGFVVEPEAEALAACMRRLKDDDTARRLGLAAYEAYWRDPPTPAAHAARLISLYGEMLARAGSRGGA
ncbi:MAG: glycosyltransferase family 4 protein [Hyphomicrobiales bacterium]